MLALNLDRQSTVFQKLSEKSFKMLLRKIREVNLPP